MPKHVLVVDDDRDHAESVAEARRAAAVDQGFGPLARWRERVGVRGTPATPPRGRSGTPPAFVEGLDARLGLGRITLPRMDIAGWLRGLGLGLGQYEPVFRDNDIDGAVLPSWRQRTSRTSASPRSAIAVGCSKQSLHYAHGSASERNCASASTICLTMADTGTSTGRLMIAVLGGLADVERDLIRTRTRRGPQPGAKARAAHGSTVETYRHAEGRSPAATCRVRDARRTRAQLRRGQEHDFEAHSVRGKMDEAGPIARGHCYGHFQGDKSERE